MVVGFDLGKATTSMAIGRIKEDGALSGITTRSERHFGKPIELFKQMYQEFDTDALSCIAATGIFSHRLKKPIQSGIPEEIAQEVATKVLHGKNGALNVVRLGARGYSIFTFDIDGSVRYEENDKCSAGTGETIEKICGRLGRSLDESVSMAMTAKKSIPISARCSVFAKTEMTHYANQGEHHEELLLGYFESVATNLYSLYDKCKVDGPVILIGNGTAIVPICDAFTRLCSFPVCVSSEAATYEAIGALYLAAEQSRDNVISWPVDPESLIRAKGKRILSLEPATQSTTSVIHLEDRTNTVKIGVAAVVGIDLGSTGSKAALIDVDTGEVITDFYRKTNGNPIEAAKNLVNDIEESTDHPIAAFGITGSGRNAAASIFKAAYPDSALQIYIENEIVAHATAAIEYDDRKGESLSIVEIGGQDAKFINIQRGRIVESDMNRACSAGTGSFLEEQAIFYGITDIKQFSKMASASKSPPVLGQMCTVFVADIASEALTEGYLLEDIFAGFQYSVIINYMNRVMGNKQFMDRICFQGKPASNPSLAQTLSAITKREVIVPSNPGAMGAIGIALLARDVISKMEVTPALDINKILNAYIVNKKIFRCKDSKCRNLCRIESVTVAIEGKQRKIINGGRCSKYEETASVGKKLPREAPNPYLERMELLNSLIAKKNIKSEAPTIGIPYGHFIMDYVPFFHTLFTELGYNVKIIHSDENTFKLGNKLALAFNTCTPSKIMHGLANADCDFLFIPKIVNIVPYDKNTGSMTCPMAQATPELVEKASIKRGEKREVLRPVLHMDKGIKSRKFMREIQDALKDFEKKVGSRNLGISFSKAFRASCKKHNSYASGLLDIGTRVIEFSKENGLPVILIMGNIHVIHEPIMNAGIHDIVANNGAIPLPLDCYPIPKSTPALNRIYSASTSRILRGAVASGMNGNIFPVLILGYGCGPGSFFEHLFNDILENYPHTVLESDGHGGQAGFVTRILAFLHTVRNYKHDPSAVIPLEKITDYDNYPTYNKKQMQAAKVSVLPTGGMLGHHIAAILRGKGIQAQSTGFTDPEGFACGKASCSGKECFPYQLIWGTFNKHLKYNPPINDKKNLLLTITGYGPCNAGMFPLLHSIALRKMGHDKMTEVMTFGNFNPYKTITLRIWFAIVANDLLTQMRYHFRPLEKISGDTDKLFDHYMVKLEELFGAMATPSELADIYYLLKTLKIIGELLVEAAKRFKAIPIIPERENEIRSVYLTGDIMLRIDDWGNDNIVKILNRHGLRILLEPHVSAYECYVFFKSREVVEFEDKWLPNLIQGVAMNYVKERLYKAVMKEISWINKQSVHDISKTSKVLFDGTPFGPALYNTGSALLAWNERRIDGIVRVGGIGCAPSHINEALFRCQIEIPMLYIYNDGDPINEDRIAGYAIRLKRNNRQKIRKR